MTAASSAAACERARKISTLIFHRLSSVGQATLAERAGASEPTVSRWKSEQVEQCAKFLAHLGLKVVPEEMRCFDPAKIGAILQLAKAHLSEIEGTEQLEWEG